MLLRKGDAMDNINVPLYHMQMSGCDFCLFVFYAVGQRWCISRLF